MRARSAPITVPTPSAPHGTAHCPQLASTAALSGEKPAASSIGALMTTATPNPVTDSKNGATPTTTPAASATGSGSILPKNHDTRSTAPPARSRLYKSNPPNRTYSTLPDVPTPPTRPSGTPLASSPGHATAPTTAAASVAAPAHTAGHRRTTNPTAATANGAAATRTPSRSTMIE